MHHGHHHHHRHSSLGSDNNVNVSGHVVVSTPEDMAKGAIAIFWLAIIGIGVVAVYYVVAYAWPLLIGIAVFTIYKVVWCKVHKVER